LWQIEESDHIVSEFKKLGSIEKKRYREAVKDLGLSDDPKKIRQYEDIGCYAYNLTKSCRLIYRVSNKEKVNNCSLLVTTKRFMEGISQHSSTES
jgi:hypothetical protein